MLAWVCHVLVYGSVLLLSIKALAAPLYAVVIRKCVTCVCRSAFGCFCWVRCLRVNLVCGLHNFVRLVLIKLGMCPAV